MKGLVVWVTQRDIPKTLILGEVAVPDDLHLWLAG